MRWLVIACWRPSPKQVRLETQRRRPKIGLAQYRLSLSIPKSILQRRDTDPIKAFIGGPVEASPFGCRCHRLLNKMQCVPVLTSSKHINRIEKERTLPPIRRTTPSFDGIESFTNEKESMTALRLPQFQLSESIAGRGRRVGRI
jgi:hypothetical protein